MVPEFVLASASPARRRLLELAGIRAIVQPSHFDESQVQSTQPGELVEQLAKHKANSVAQDCLSRGQRSLVLGCDSVLAIAGEIHGKPSSAAEAIARWQLMRGRVGELYTGHALIDLAQDRALVKAQVTRVHFAQVTDPEIAAYVATGEPMQCAGCFALEGKGGLLIEQLEGCHTNVIGLSLPLLRRLLTDLGYDVQQFWTATT
ncbi:MAG: nucleoside triphosphate pyrophosphatase [Cyanobacteria bacterium P01_H01_bin.121]